MKSVSRNKKLPFAERLVDACKAVPAIEKLGQNDDYDYVKASQIYEAFRMELLSRGILLLPDQKECRREHYDDGYQVFIRVEYELRDCYTADHLIKAHFGAGEDHDGKGLYRATTGACKYFLRGLGIIPWLESDDPEFGEQRQKPSQSFTKMTKQEKQEDSKLRAWHSAIRQGGKTEPQVMIYLLQEHNCKSIRDLFLDSRKEELSKAMAWALQADIMPSLTASVTLAEEVKKRKGTTSVISIEENKKDVGAD